METRLHPPHPWLPSSKTPSSSNLVLNVLHPCNDPIRSILRDSSKSTHTALPSSHRTRTFGHHRNRSRHLKRHHSVLLNWESFGQVDLSLPSQVDDLNRSDVLLVLSLFPSLSIRTNERVLGLRCPN